MHYNFKRDFKWNSYLNSLKSAFLITEFQQAKILYEVLQNAKTKFGGQYQRIVNEMFAVLVPNDVLNTKNNTVYKRLQAFVSLTDKEQINEKYKEPKKRVDNCEKIEYLHSDQYLMCKCNLKEYIYVQVLNVVKVCNIAVNLENRCQKLSKAKEVQMQLCLYLIYIYKYPVLKRDIDRFVD